MRRYSSKREPRATDREICEKLYIRLSAIENRTGCDLDIGRHGGLSSRNRVRCGHSARRISCHGSRKGGHDQSRAAGGARFDIGHFWEDICFKNGPLVNPSFFAEHVGPHYKRITDIVHKHGIELVSLDCDGMIDALIPTWIENGVNVMFPIEVGTWNASIEPWRREYGRRLLGVGGMDKRVFAQDYAAVDKEVERLKALVDLGGYLPCVDHRVPGDAEWDNVNYYCEAMRQAFPA